MKKFISILVCAIIILSVFALPASAAGSQVFAQYDTGNEFVDSGTVSVRPCYKSNSYATLDGYAYCNKNNNTRNMGAHTFSLVGNRSTSLYSTLSKFWQMEETLPSSSLRKTCPSMSSVVQAMKYTTGTAVSSEYTETATNTYCLFNNPNWYLTSSYTLSIFSTLHNYYSSSNDFFMYPVVVNY